MTEHAHEEVRRLFDMVLDVPASQRASVLERECAGDEGLKLRILAMITAAEDDRFLADATADLVNDETLIATPREQVGQMIGRYKLLEQIGEGGFGSVWAAEQREPVKRRVAIKIIKLGMDTKQVIARFEAERQALAMMDHPNIAKVLDAGSTDTGRPFFAMELVKGVPILDYCDTEKLDTKERLDLFMNVCHAIQHAHQKGIIHRDIKPSNVMITLHDGVPVPKVIDFGIAKATNQELTEKTIYTQHQQMIGTPAYMSPEQAEMSGLDIDTRADIYSLGVLLYELLTGTTPFDTRSLMEAGLAEMMRMIREETPHKPSTRLSTLGETGTRTALQRQTDIKKLGLVLRGDLDWIVMKCLEKDRGRRYDTANGLSADIARHLGDEPVLAGPPSAKYRLAKFVKRNRGQVIAGGVVAAALVLAVVGTSTGMAWALQEKDRADTEATNASLAAEAETEARLDAEANERKAIESAERAERELARATEIKRLITEMLQSVDPEVAQTADKTLLLGILDDAAQRLKAGEITDELIAAELHGVVGSVYLSLGLYEQAELHLPVTVEIRSRLLGEEHPDTQRPKAFLAILYGRQSRFAEAEPLFLKAIEFQKRELGEEHESTLNSIANLAALYGAQGRYADAEPLRRKTLEIQKRVLGEEHPDTLLSIGNLATLCANQGRVSEAESLHLETLEIQKRVLGEEHPDTLVSMANLAIVYRSQGRYAEAESLFLETLELQKHVLGEEHPFRLRAMNDLAHVYRLQRRYAAAESLSLETLESQRRVLGGEHRDSLASMANLARVYSAQGRHAEAESLFLETLELRKCVLGEEHPDTLLCMANLAIVYRSQGRYAEAESLFLETLELYKRVLGEEDTATVSCKGELGRVYLLQGLHAKAESLYLEVLEVRRRVLGDEDPATLGAITNLGILYNAMGRYDDAAEMLEESLPNKRRVLGPQHPWTEFARQSLATAYLELGQRADATQLYRESLAEQPDADANTLNNAAWFLLTHDLERLRDPERALAYAERACALEEAADGASLWMYLDTLALAQHLTSDTASAIQTQQRAIAFMPSPDADPDMVGRLAEYEAALAANGGR